MNANAVTPPVSNDEKLIRALAEIVMLVYSSTVLFSVLVAITIVSFLFPFQDTVSKVVIGVVLWAGWTLLFIGIIRYANLVMGVLMATFTSKE